MTRITDEANSAARHAYHQSVMAPGTNPQDWMRAALEAATPAIRQQVAEEIAEAIDALRDSEPGTTPVPRGFLTDAARIAREIGGAS